MYPPIAPQCAPTFMQRPDQNTLFTPNLNPIPTFSHAVPYPGMPMGRPNLVLMPQGPPTVPQGVPPPSASPQPLIETTRPPQTSPNSMLGIAKAIHKQQPYDKSERQQKSLKYREKSQKRREMHPMNRELGRRRQAALRRPRDKGRFVKKT